MGSRVEQFNHVEVAGDIILPVISGISGNALCKVLLSKYELSIDNIQPGAFYPYTKYMSLLYEIEEKMPTVLKKIGELVNLKAPLPPEVVNFEVFLTAMNQIFYMYHRGCQEGELGSLTFEKVSDKELILIDSTQYPCVFKQGAFVGAARQLGNEISISHVDDNCTSKGDPYCKYRIQVS